LTFEGLIRYLPKRLRRLLAQCCWFAGGVVLPQIRAAEKGERIVLKDLAEGMVAKDFVTLAHVQRYLFAEQYSTGRIVLDVGCGSGYGTAHLSRAGAKLAIGVDCSALAIRYAKKWHDNERTEFVIMDACALGFRAAFDLAVCFDVLEHLQRPTDALRQICQAMTIHGVAIIGTPNRSVSGLDNPHHVSELSLPEFQQLLGSFFNKVVVLGQDLVVGGKRLGQNWRWAPPRLSFSLHNFALVDRDVDICFGLLAICRRA